MRLERADRGFEIALPLRGHRIGEAQIEVDIRRIAQQLVVELRVIGSRRTLPDRMRTGDQDKRKGRDPCLERGSSDFPLHGPPENFVLPIIHGNAVAGTAK